MAGGVWWGICIAEAPSGRSMPEPTGEVSFISLLITGTPSCPLLCTYSSIWTSAAVDLEDLTRPYMCPKPGEMWMNRPAEQTLNTYLLLFPNLLSLNLLSRGDPRTSKLTLFLGSKNMGNEGVVKMPNPLIQIQTFSTKMTGSRSAPEQRVLEAIPCVRVLVN